MIKLQKIDPFEVSLVYPPIIMPESSKNRKKGQAFMVLAPSIESEFQYMSTNINQLNFRYLMKYFVDKKWMHTLYGQGYKTLKPNENGEITTLLMQHHEGNMKNIDGVVSYLPSVKTRVLKDFNVLVEANYGAELIMNNPKDRRMMAIKAKEIVEEYIRVKQSASAGGYLGNYETNIIIPMNLWFSLDDYKVPAATMKPKSKLWMGHILRIISDPAILKRLGKVYLIHDRTILLLDPENIPDKADKKADYISSLIIRFMTKARNKSEEPTAENPIIVDEPEDQEPAPEKITTTQTKESKIVTPSKPAKTIKEKETETKKEVVVDKVMEKIGADPDNPEARAKVKKVVEKNINIDQVDIAKDIEVEDIKLSDPGDVDTLLAAKSEGKTVASYQRDQVLKEKYKELSMGDVPLTKVLEAEKKYEIPTAPVNVHTVNPDMKNIKAMRFEETYNENVMQQDLVNILLHFSRVHPAMFLNKDIGIEDVSTPTDRVMRYTVQFEDENRKRHKFSFKLPKMYADKYLYLNDQEMNISHQKLPFPVTKVSPDECQAVTSYNKIFTQRYGSNLSPRITKIKKIFVGPNCPRIAKAYPGNSTIPNSSYLTTIEYDDIGSVLTRLDMGGTTDNTRIYFIVNDAKIIISMDRFKKTKFESGEPLSNMLPLAVRNKKPSEVYCISSRSNKVYDSTGKSHGELSEFIVEVASWYDPKVADEFEALTAGTKFVYTRSMIMKKDVPTILVCAAADPGGLVAVLEKSKINYSFSEKRPTNLNKDDQAIIPFADGYLVYDRYPYENSLLLNGLNTFPTKNYNFYDMGTYDAYVQIFDTMFGSRNLPDSLRNFYYMFVDPITTDVLVKLNMPTDFTRLMLYCNDVLADNTYQIDSDYHNSRIRSNEIIMARLYYELAEAWGYYRLGKTDTFSIPEDAVIKYLLTSNIVDPHSQLNMVLEMENDRLVKLKGPSGMNEDHSFTIEKRAYHPSMQGVIGMNSTPTGEVGIGRHMVLNPNIDDARGFMTIEKDDYSGSEMATPGELMAAFTPESADIERVAMAISQSKHEVPVTGYSSCPISYDMERVAPHLSNDFARTAKKNGKVVAIENDIMIIKYDDGTIDDVDLSSRPNKNTDGGFYIMNNMETKLKVGSRVKEGDIVAYNPKFINNNDMFGDPLANLGVMAKVAIETNGGVYEDSCYIRDGFAHKMATRITRQKRVILTKYANIKSIVQIGDLVLPNDPLITFDDTNDEFTSQMLASMADEIGDSDEVIAGTTPVLAKVRGTIVDIQIYYTADPAEMSPSMKKLLDKYIKEVSKREKTLSKYENVYDARTIVKTSQRLTPDAQGKVKGVKLPDGVMIDFYIEYEDIMAPGDKLSVQSALKGVVSNVIPDNLAPYTERYPEEKIDVCVSAIGVYKRMLADVLKNGSLGKVVVERKRQMRDKYSARIKEELKKMK